MGKIVTKTVEQVTYISSDGRETVLSDMADPHLVNAFGQACQQKEPNILRRDPESVENDQLVKALRGEILRRLALCKSSNET